ncbi:MAG: ATP-binding protein [Kofleriaceae bacterium]
MIPSDLGSAFSFDAIPIAVLVFELDGMVVAANPAACRMIGHPAARIVGRPVRALAPSISERWPLMIAQLRTTGESVDQVAYQPPDGPIRYLKLVLSLAPGQSPERIRGFAFDVTVHELAEQAARARAAVEDKQASRQRLESLGQLAGGIAHDFNNLLVGVLAEASAAREDRNLAEATRESLRRIEASARRMAQLTRQLLAYSGRAQFVTAPIAADDLVGELREHLASVVPPGIELAIDLAGSPAVVEADAGLLRQVVLNLATNAAEAARQRIAIETRRVSRDGLPWWQLELSDDGPGIESATLARIFEPFFTTKPGHHGLGLSAVYGIVRRLNGDVEVDSVPGHGARFRIHLPVLADTAAAPRHAVDANLPGKKLTGIRALVADDEPSVRVTVRRLLERRGAVVVMTADGPEAEDQLRDATFDLVVSDVSMPGSSGYDVLAVARALHPNTRVILMSGYTERPPAGAEHEPDAFLEKPFTAKALDVAIDEVLKGNR